ncbi:nuclear RNA export factor 1-like [Podargus strigoides]
MAVKRLKVTELGRRGLDSEEEEEAAAGFFNGLDDFIPQKLKDFGFWQELLLLVSERFINYFQFLTRGRYPQSTVEKEEQPLAGSCEREQRGLKQQREEEEEHGQACCEFREEASNSRHGRGCRQRQIATAMAKEVDGRYGEYDDSGRRKKGQGPWRGKLYREVSFRYWSRTAPSLRTHLEEDDSSVPVSKAHNGLCGRYAPYGPRPSRTCTINHTVQRDWGPLPERGGGSQGSGCRSWFKITIPYGEKYNKSWLLSSIQQLCSVPFTPVEFHYVHGVAQFYVEDATTACALKQVSHKIIDRDNYKVVIITSASAPPQSVQDKLKTEETEQLKLCMNKRYDSSRRALDLKSLHLDPDLVSQGIDAVLNRRSCMSVVLRIIEENIPELQCLSLSNNKLRRLDHLSALAQKAAGLKILDLSHNKLESLQQLSNMKGLELEELRLNGNPICDQSSYISSIRERFPKLLRLDGHELPPPITFDVEAPPSLPPCKGSYFASDDQKGLVLWFLQQYYSIYDSSNRQGLLDLYHDGACLSTILPVGPQDLSPARNSLNDYFKDSRDVKKLKDPVTHFKALKHSRLNVVMFLNGLPRTQHDVSSFVVDISAQTNTLLCFTIHGVFKEVDGKSQELAGAFTRTFIAVPSRNTGLCIVNDQLLVQNASLEELGKAFQPPTPPAPAAPTVPAGPVPILTPEQQEMVAAFTLQTGMNIKWSQKCLEENNWNYGQARQIFTQLKLQGTIPEVAFLK